MTKTAKPKTGPVTIDDLRERIERVRLDAKRWQRSVARSGGATTANALNRELERIIRKPLRAIAEDLPRVAAPSGD